MNIKKAYDIDMKYQTKSGGDGVQGTTLQEVKLAPDTVLMIREKLAEGIAKSIVTAAIAEINVVTT